MAISSIDITIVSNPYKGLVEISSTVQQGASESIEYVLIYRRLHGTLDDYVRVYQKVITSTSQLTFEDTDITVRAGDTYDYYIELTDGITAGYTVIEFGTISSVECWFDGLFIGDYDTQYLAPLNCNTSTTRNTQASYVTTLAGRTPYRVSNANLNYTTGQSSALFVPLDEYHQPVKLTTKEYTEQVVDFLTNGENKILKTSDGRVWCVSIDPDVSISFDDYYIGSSTISFNWTEIDDVPTTKKVTTE